MIKPEIKSQMITLIEQETDRIQYGKILVEITVMKLKCTNIQVETKRSMNLNEPERSTGISGNAYIHLKDRTG